MKMEMSLILMGYKKHQFIIILVMTKMKKISRMVGTGLIYLMNRIQDLKWDHFLGNKISIWNTGQRGFYLLMRAVVDSEGRSMLNKWSIKLFEVADSKKRICLWAGHILWEKMLHYVQRMHQLWTLNVHKQQKLVGLLDSVQLLDKGHTGRECLIQTRLIRSSTKSKVSLKSLPDSYHFMFKING